MSIAQRVLFLVAYLVVAVVVGGITWALDGEEEAWTAIFPGVLWPLTFVFFACWGLGYLGMKIGRGLKALGTDSPGDSQRECGPK